MIALLAAGLLCGCSHTDQNGVRTQLVIGFGVVRTASTNEIAGTVLKVKTLGLYTGNGAVSLGWMDRTRVEIKTNSNVLLEIK